MRTKMLLLAGGCALAFAAPASAAPGQCFDAGGQPIGPVFEIETPDVRFTTWVQAQGGECRGLRADEVTLYRGRSGEYPQEYRRVEVPAIPRVAPGAPPTAPGETVTTWQGDPVAARRLIVMHYQAQHPNLTVTDTGRVVELSGGGHWRIYDTVYSDGTRRQVAVQMQSDRQYVLMESTQAGSWNQQVIELED